MIPIIFMHDRKIMIHILGDGSITKEEFSNAFASKFNASQDHATKVFSKLDKDGSGDISVEEIYDLFKLMDDDGKYKFCIYFLFLPFHPKEYYSKLYTSPVVIKKVKFQVVVMLAKKNLSRHGKR